MFEQLGAFDPAAPPGVSRTEMGSLNGIQQNRTISERLTFWGANLLVMPIIAMIYAQVVAEGLRLLMPVFQLRLYKLPFPGAGLARDYDGFDRLDLAILMSLLLFVVVTWLWIRIFSELQGFGRVYQRRKESPVVFGLLSFVAFIIVAGDAMIFYVGISTQSASGWTETPGYVAPAATLIYSCGLAMLGWWHSDYKHSDIM
ncbi:hypothetical protein [Rhodopirellula europaea]|uniref:hypothetical protein n=1 Tax=Rhodopirellula europaea TaxID=1263866 RepID=UPI003D298307